MAVVWTTVAKASEAQGVKACVYGGAGVGKTMLCSTAPKPLIVSAESGLLTYKKRVHEGLMDPNIPVAEVNDLSDVEEVLTWCKAHAVTSGIQTVCLDSMSEIVEKCLSAARAKTKDPRQAYGEMATLATDLIKVFRDIPGLHVLITAKEAKAKDEMTGVTTTQPQAPGQQVGPSIPYLFDLVMQAYTDKTPDGTRFYALRTAPSFGVIAKDRSQMLDEVEYPDFNNIINKIKNLQGA